jgi:hypothetical protein
MHTAIGALNQNRVKRETDIAALLSINNTWMMSPGPMWPSRVYLSVVPVPGVIPPAAPY